MSKLLRLLLGIAVMVLITGCSFGLQGSNGINISGNESDSSITIGLDGSVVRGVLADSGNATGSGQWISILGSSNATTIGNGSTITIDCEVEPSVSGFYFLPQVAGVVEILSGATTPMTCLINGVPTVTSVVYDTDSAEMRVITGRVGRLILWNSTRSTSRKVVSIDETTNTITTESTIDSWANNDVLTFLSQTVGHAFVDLDVISGSSPAIPAGAVAVKIEVLLMEQTALGANEDVIMHPCSTWGVGSEQYMKVQVVGRFNQFVTDIPVVNNRISFSVRAATKMYFFIEVIGYWLP